MIITCKLVAVSLPCVYNAHPWKTAMCSSCTSKYIHVHVNTGVCTCTLEASRNVCNFVVYAFLHSLAWVHIGHSFPSCSVFKCLSLWLSVHRSWLTMNGGDWKTSSFPEKNCLSLEVVWTKCSKKSAHQKHLFYRLFSSSHYKCIHPSTLEETFMCFWSTKMAFPDGTGVGKLSCWNPILKLEPKKWCLKGYRYATNALQTPPTPPMSRKTVQTLCCIPHTIYSTHIV